MMALPLIPFVVTLLFGALAWLWLRYLSRFKSVLGLKFNFMCTDQHEFRAYIISWLLLDVPFLNVAYNGICMRIFNTFSCLTLRDGTKVLTVAPEVICWETLEHHVLIGTAVLCIVIYIIGIPAYVFGTMTYARKHNRFVDREWLQVLGFLYRRYTPKHHLWELAFLSRRFLFCLSAVAFRTHPLWQGVLPTAPFRRSPARSSDHPARRPVGPQSQARTQSHTSGAPLPPSHARCGVAAAVKQQLGVGYCRHLL
jgi:hypothetical protein